MNSFVSKARTALALGLPNIARAVSYRLGVTLGLNPVRRLRAATPQGPFFRSVRGLRPVTVPTVSAWQSSALLFSFWPAVISDKPPDWLANPINGQRVAAPEREWWQIPDFDPIVGDIKLIWELSRMDWVLAFAQRVRHGEAGALERLNGWLSDWCAQNPPYKGPNWKCGQEASIRVMHLGMAAVILGQVRSVESGLRDLVRLHLQRIAPTVQYAMSQDNNHGTSEAAALFIGGSWLATCGSEEGKNWARSGRRWLENRASRLIGKQGSFSQYSLNYHRVMLDTLCMAEVWRRQLGLPNFSAQFQASASAATQWLRHMVTSVSGDGPNVGANDGARLLQLTDTPYRDYRPSVQLAMALFDRKRAYAQTGPWDDALEWLGVELPKEVAEAPQSYIADDGGFAILRRRSATAMLRYPRFRFRPSQADALHVDFWLGGENLLRDAGTYSYHTDLEWLNYFGGTVSHNTVQFDARDQMPRLGRFLLGDWLKTVQLSALSDDGEASQFVAGYRDSFGATHLRSVTLKDTFLQVTDELYGLKDKAVLRWRLIPGDWHLEHTPAGPRLTLASSYTLRLHISANVPLQRCELVLGWESRHYLEKSQLPVLEVEVNQAGKLTTEMQWTA